MFENLDSASRTMTTLRSCWASRGLPGGVSRKCQGFMLWFLMVWQSNGVGYSVSFRQRRTKPCTRSAGFGSSRGFCGHEPLHV